MAAVLQTARQLGVLVAMLASLAFSWPTPRIYRYVFLVGILPALWCCGFAAPCPSPRSGTPPRPRPRTRRARIADLFRGRVRRTTILTILVCAVA